MNSRTVILGAVALAAVLAATLWYQLVPQDQKVVRATPSPVATVVASRAPTPLATPTPQIARSAPTPISATTGPAFNLFAMALVSAVSGLTGLTWTFKRA